MEAAHFEGKSFSGSDFGGVVSRGDYASWMKERYGRIL